MANSVKQNAQLIIAWMLEQSDEDDAMGFSREYIAKEVGLPVSKVDEALFFLDDLGIVKPIPVNPSELQ